MNIELKIAELKEELNMLEKQLEREKYVLPKMIEIPRRKYSFSETPITVAQYQVYCLSTGEIMSEQPTPHNDNNPVVNVTWFEAKKYCEWLSKELGVPVRLPMEDEFEYCCADHQVGTEATAVFDCGTITQVKTKQPNKFGLYDMLGLVWEWQEV